MTTVPRYTSRDLELLPDPLDDTRYEIIDGNLFVSKQPHIHHQYVCGMLSAAFGAWDPAAATGLSAPAPGLIFSPDNDVAPDLIWISRARLAKGVDRAGHLRTAPELVIEVLSFGSTNERRDREFKLSLYSRQGVHEYWIVDWRQRAAQVYRRREAALHLVATLENDDALTSPLLPGFVCPLARLWGPDIETIEAEDGL